jgi:hypothetical protein
VWPGVRDAWARVYRGEGGALSRVSGVGAVTEGTEFGSDARVLVSGPAHIPAQLCDPGNAGDGYQHAPADGGDQHRHSQRERADEPDVMNFDARRVLQNKDNEHHQQQERGSGGHPGGAGAR